MEGMKDLPDREVTWNLFRVANEHFQKFNTPISKEEADAVHQAFLYLVCLDREQYMDMTTLPLSSDGWKVHPLPLLTSNGNGRGGGDYLAEIGKEYIGLWAGLRVAALREVPEGFDEIKPDFKEIY